VEIPLPLSVEFSVEKVWKFRLCALVISFVDVSRDLRVNGGMNAKQTAKAIRAEIKALETRCDNLKKIATELEAENGGANPKSGKPLSDKKMSELLRTLRKEKTAHP
jgi:hypothetical protein